MTQSNIDHEAAKHTAEYYYTLSDKENHHFGNLARAYLDSEKRVAELGKTLHDLYPLWRLVWEQEISYREFECEHGFGPPASLCPNEKCIDRQVEAAIRVLEDTLNPQETHDDA